MFWHLKNLNLSELFHTCKYIHCIIYYTVSRYEIGLLLKIYFFFPGKGRIDTFPRPWLTRFSHLFVVTFPNFVAREDVYWHSYDPFFPFYTHHITWRRRRWIDKNRTTQEHVSIWIQDSQRRRSFTVQYRGILDSPWNWCS